MKKKLNIYIAVAAISFVQGLQISIAPVLGSIAEHYNHVNISLVQMLITIPAFVSMFFSVVCGWLVLKVSKKKMLLFASALAGAAGLLPLAADSFGLLFASRALYGVALGWCASLNTAVVSEFFEGDERVTAMGIQAASVGAGMMLLSGLSGMLGKTVFTHAYFVNGAAFLSMLLILIFLPDTGKAVESETEKVRLNRSVIPIYVFIFLEMMFLITFSTNISMHISGTLAGNSSVSGTLTSVFSGAQILVGMVLGAVTKILTKYVLPAAMLCFAFGAFLLVVFSDSFVMLMIAALFCGFSQGLYIPSGFVDVSNAVPPVAVALASACFNAASCIGQTISPYLTNTLSKAFFGAATTEGVYVIAACGMALAALAHMYVKKRQS